MPSIIPAILLIVGLTSAIVITGVVTSKAQRGATGAEALRI